jgi:hypothetical protein
MARNAQQPRVDTTRGPTYPNVQQKPKRRIRIKQLSRVNTIRGGAPTANLLNLFPFPFGNSDPARHGHHPRFPVGAVRRVGAWRTSGVLGAGNKPRKY